MNTSAAARTLAVFLALVSLTVGFGAVDLLSPWILHEGTQVSEVGYGSLAGLIIPVGLLSQAWKPELHLAGLQQVALAAFAYLAAGSITGQRPLILAGVLTTVAAIGVGALRPGRQALIPQSRRPSLLLLALALAAAAPGSQYALHMAYNQRDGTLPDDAHLGLGHWAALSAAAIATLLAALLASLRTPGFTIPGLTSAAAVLTWATTCLLYPYSAGALNRTWAGLAVAWALAFGAATIHARRKPRTPGCSWRRVALRRPHAPSPGCDVRRTKVTVGHVMLRLRSWCLGLGSSRSRCGRSRGPG